MAGCYGKIPALGDFLSRNLPGAFVETWDGWLRQAMSTCAWSGGEQWVDRYLSSPIWRFALAPGVAGPVGRAGILVPSVDSVGRCFPLTVAIEIPAALPAVDMATAWADGYERAEMIAIGALGRALTPEAFVERLGGLPAPSPTAAADPPAEWWSGSSASPAGARMAGAPPDSGNARDMAAALALSMVAATQGGLSLWWHLDWEGRPATTALFVGLPPPEAVAEMLLGSGEDGGWSR